MILVKVLRGLVGEIPQFWRRPASLPGERVLVFDQYDNGPRADAARWSGLYEVQHSYQLIFQRDAILKNRHHKRQLNRMLSTFDMGAAVTIDIWDTGVFGRDEADVTIISYVLQAVGRGNNAVRILCEYTDVFVLLVIWTWMNQLVDKCQTQMERCDGAVLPSTSFPFNKGKVSALRVFEAGYFPGLFHVLREEDARQWDLLEVGLSFFCALYSQKPGTPMEVARYNLYTKTKAGPRLRNLPPNSTNLLLHVQLAHLQMPLLKALPA